MAFSSKAECIRKTINNSSLKDYFKFDKDTYNASKLIKALPVASPKLQNLIDHIKELDENDFKKYGKKFKHIIYSDLRNSNAGIKFVAAALRAFGMNNIYNNKFAINIPEGDNNFALLSSVAIYNKPFPVKLRNEILKIFNKRPDNIYGENVRFLLIDQGFKEGIDVFDVKYVHIFDELITPADEKQVIGRGTRFCGQKGLEFNSELAWPLHVFKYKLELTEELKEKYGAIDAFSWFLKESKIDIRKLYFAAELENICRFGAVDYEINKAIHEFGNDKEDVLDVSNVVDKINNFQTFKIKDIYSSLDKNTNEEFELVKKAYKKFGGVGNKLIAKRKNLPKFLIKPVKVKPIERTISKKLDFIEMRTYIRKFFKDYKWTNLSFKNECIDTKNPNQAPKRIVDLSNSQLFVSNYFTANSSYKGILFWHSVGTGKTCSAIATASNTFEKEDYTILWVTRHTLKPDIWKNIYTQVCSITIKEKIEKGIEIPEVMKTNPLKYLDNKWIVPISYKQFSNLILGKNIFYNELVKRNGKKDPLKKTLIIIDEAHKLFAEDTPVNERPNIKILKNAIYNSYKISQKESCKLILMTATPYTNDPMQLFKLINLLKEDDYITEDFDKFREEYLDEHYKFKKEKSYLFLDKISGYISYLNRERDVRQFAYPVIYIRNIGMSVDEKPMNDIKFYEKFFDDIKDYVKLSISGTNDIIDYLKLMMKDKKISEDIISQEKAFKLCVSKAKEKKGKKKGKEEDEGIDNEEYDEGEDDDEVNNKKIKNLITSLKSLIKEQNKINKDKEKKEKKEKKDLEKKQKKELKTKPKKKDIEEDIKEDGNIS